MRYIKIKNGQPVNYSIDQLFIDYPGAIIYNESQMPNSLLLSNYGVYPLITEPTPQLAEDEIAEEGVPEFQYGEWHQTWTVRKLTENEIQEIIESKKRFLDIDSAGPMEQSMGFLANKELQEQRYTICQSCSAFTALKTCRECGCIMPLKIKIAKSVCPINKW